MRPAVLLALALLAPLPLASGQDAHAAKDPRNFDWVTEGVLAIGGGGLSHDDVEWLHEAGFRAIADFRIEHQDPEEEIRANGMTFFDMPIDSASNVNATQLAAFVAWATEQRDAGRPIYIHCTNGWHRAAAFAVAWAMATEDKSYDDAAREAVARRPGTVMRAIPGLLDYQAELTGEPGLAVALAANTTHPGLNGTMEAHVEVFANGAPAVGANVRVWSEESKLRIDGVTDANGRFHFTYAAPKQAFMDHVYARASLDGQLDGADSVEFVFGQAAKARGPVEVSAEAAGEDDVVVRVMDGGKPITARVIALAPGYTAFEATDKGVVTLRDVPRGVPVEVRAVSWGSDGGITSVTLAPPPPPVVEPTPEPTPAPPTPDKVEPVPPEPPAPEPVVDDHGHVHAVRYAAGAIAGTACLLALYAVLSRKRAGAGNR